MTTLLQTLKFKNVSSELTDDEFDAFLCTLHRRKGRELLLRLLCQQSAPSVSADMLQIASSIIQKREKQQQQTSRWTLDMLPSAFIGEIASNLKQGDYASFSRANRSIYIGCNDPNRLSKVYVSTYLSSLTQYRQMEKLEITKIANCSNLQLPICAHLKYLYLHCFFGGTDLNFIINETSFQAPRLQHLSLSTVRLSSDDIFYFSANFNKIQHLELNEASIELTVLDSMANATSTLFTKLFPNLNSLTLFESDEAAAQFLKYRGAQLCQLDLYSFTRNENQINQSLLDDVLKVKFTKIQRLRINHQVPADIIEHLLSNSPNLSQICYWLNSLENDPSKHELTDRITGILKEQICLTDLYIYSRTSEPLDYLCQAIECGLMVTRKWKRKLMRIGIETSYTVEWGKAIMHISGILTRLLLCNIKEFVVFLKIDQRQCLNIKCSEEAPCECCAKDQTNRKAMEKEIKDLVDDMGTVELMRSAGYVFIIKNRQSKINAYKMWWNEGKFDSFDLNPVVY